METLSKAEQLDYTKTHIPTSDHILHDTYKSTLLNSENSEILIEFKEYSVDEFLRELTSIMNLYENGKYCTKCKNNKNIEDFGRNRNWCKACKNTSFKEYYNRNQEKMKENLKKDYEKRKSLMICACGKVINCVSYKAHLKTKSHYNLLNKK